MSDTVSNNASPATEVTKEAGRVKLPFKEMVSYSFTDMAGNLLYVTPVSYTHLDHVVLRIWRVHAVYDGITPPGPVYAAFVCGCDVDHRIVVNLVRLLDAVQASRALCAENPDVYKRQAQRCQ